MVHVAVTACRPGEAGVTAMCEGSERILRDRIASLTRSARITILIHGYRFNPGHPGRDPCRLLYAFRPEVTDSRIASWPTGLGYSRRSTQAAGSASASDGRRARRIWTPCGSGVAPASRRSTAMLLWPVAVSPS